MWNSSRRLLFAALIPLAATLAATCSARAHVASLPASSGGPDQHNIIPLLNLRCTVCHGLRQQEGGLDLRTKAAMLKGGKSGPAIVPGKPRESLLLKRIHAKEMPPRKLLVRSGVRPMAPSEADLLARWIAAGAPVVEIRPDVATPAADPLVSDDARNFWAFRPPARPQVPQLHDPRFLIRNPADAFVFARLKRAGLPSSAPADRLTLIRRVAFNLTGLPPDWDDVEEFLADDSPAAYERMLDRYLASPRYGERWAQFWLDAAGYADSEGKRSADVVRQHAWRYRDYVVRAFNDDRPYDLFLKQQIAGDELADYRNRPVTPEVYDNLVATGFLRMAPDGTGSDIVNTVAERFEVVSDEIDVFSATVMGLTLKCAQCHDHKYDPIPQRDYYRMVALFKGAYDVHDWLKSTSVRNQSRNKSRGRVLPLAMPEDQHRFQAEMLAIEEKKASLNRELQQARKKLKGTNLRRVRTRIQKQLKQLGQLQPEPPAIRALWDRGVPSPTYIYRRGDYRSPGRLVGPGVPSVLTDGKQPFVAATTPPGANSTGLRLALANWLTRSSHPLTARVMVNRIWSHHFGRGLVRTLGNFGKTGSRPTHPQLLDWLAVDFSNAEFARTAEFSRPLRSRTAWSVKRLHRLILGSAAYRQSSRPSPRLERLDPGNALLSRMPLRRLEAEALRDSLIRVAGRLDNRPFGRPDPVEVRADGLVTSKESSSGWRRSIYVLHRRKEMPTILENFDLPQMIPNCIERPSSTVASQALHLLNNGMVRKLARRFAARVEREAGDKPYLQVERAYQLALSRMPGVEEKRLGVAVLLQLRKQWSAHVDSVSRAGGPEQPGRRALATFCHTLMNSAEFLYFD